MPHISSLEQANRLLSAYVPQVAALTGEDSTLERNRPLMEALGNPEKKLRVVHIAGTSGKTSTAYYMAALLRATEKKIGLTVSPHLDSVTERIQIDGLPISDAQFCDYLGEFLDIVEAGNFTPSYFELLTAFAFWVFARESVDYAVIETGMGGRYDTTNVAARTDKLCIITDIGFDHMHILGTTLPEIANQKAGIMHAGNDVVLYEQSDEVNEVMRHQAEVVAAKLHFMTDAKEAAAFTDVLAEDLPEFQKRNWLLAYAAYRFLQGRDALPFLNDSILRTTQAIHVPGRMDIRQIGNKTIVMDGAHNGQKVQKFVESFAVAYPGVKPAVLVALKKGKEPTDVAPVLSPFADHIIVTEFSTSQDLPAVSIPAAELAGVFEHYGADNVIAEPDRHIAFDLLLAQEVSVCVIIGSFYLLSQLRTEEGLV